VIASREASGIDPSILNEHFVGKGQRCRQDEEEKN